MVAIYNRNAAIVDFFMIWILYSFGYFLAKILDFDEMTYSLNNIYILLLDNDICQL